MRIKMATDSMKNISLCRLCCSKMYTGESMTLPDTLKIQAWFRWYNNIYIEFLPGFSNEFCHFCLYKLDMFLRTVWKNEKVANSSSAKLARKTCPDNGTYGWSFCRVCLGAIKNPEACLTIKTYGIEDINAMLKLVGIKVTFSADHPEYLCFLCVSSIHKFFNQFLQNKEKLTPRLENFYQSLQRLPVPKLEGFTSHPNLPDIRNPCTSIVEILFSHITVKDFVDYVNSDNLRPSDNSQAQAASLTSNEPQKPLQVVRPEPRFAQQHFTQMTEPTPTTTVHHPLPPNPFLNDMQRQIDQIKVNQYLNAARNTLTHLGVAPPPMVSPLAVHMAMAQSSPMLYRPYALPFNMLPPMYPPNYLAPLGASDMSNLYVKRMREEVANPEEPLEKKRRRRGRKSNVAPTYIPRSAVIEEAPNADPDYRKTTPATTMASSNTWVPNICSQIDRANSSPSISPQTVPQVVSSPPQEATLDKLQFKGHQRSSPVAPSLQVSSLVPPPSKVISPVPPPLKVSSPPGTLLQVNGLVPPPSNVSSPVPPPSKVISPVPPPLQISSPPVSKVASPPSNQPVAPLPSFETIFNNARVISSPSPAPLQQFPKVAKTSDLLHQMEILHGHPASPPSTTSPPRVPPIKINLLSGQVINSPPRPGVIQKAPSPSQMVLGALMPAPAADKSHMDYLSLKSLLDNSPPASRVPEANSSSGPKLDSNSNYKEMACDGNLPNSF